jgi:benzoate transport
MGIAAEVAPAPGDAGIRRWTPLQLLVVALCVLINMLDGMDVMVIAYVAPAMAADWGVGFEALGVIFSAGLAGMMIGCVFVAPFADTFGRRPIILLALAIMTVGMCGTGLVNTIPEFVIFRALAGVGIGTLLASIAALVAEYAPLERRSFAIGLFQAGYPVGAVLTGIVCVFTIPAFGWQATLIGAGLVSAVVLPIAYFWLPESVAYLENRQPPRALERINALRHRLGWLTLSELAPPTIAGVTPGVGKLFAAGLWRSTLILWFATFLGFAVLYFVTSWIPKLSMEAGLSAEKAIWAGSIFNLGGMIGTTSIGWFAAQYRIGHLIRGYMVAAAVFLVIFSANMPLLLVLGVAMLIGLFLQGGFSGFYSLAAKLYPADVRSSGIGWAIGMGRGGAIIGPLAGGLLLAREVPLWGVFATFAIPLVVSGVLASLVRLAPDSADSAMFRESAARA